MSSQENGTTITDHLRQLLAEVDPETGQTNYEKLMDTLRKKAAAGDAEAAKLLRRYANAPGPWQRESIR